MSPSVCPTLLADGLFFFLLDIRQTFWVFVERLHVQLSIRIKEAKGKEEELVLLLLDGRLSSLVSGEWG